MKNAVHDLEPVLIGFDLPENLEQLLSKLNGDLDRSKIDFTRSIPHITLWMGFIKRTQVGALNLGLKKIFSSSSVKTELGALETYNSEFGNVLSWEVQTTRALYLFQNRIHLFFEPFREICSDYKPLDKQTTNYINTFASKSLDNYSPHITLGFGELIDQPEFDRRLTLRDPKMFTIGNYCTCISEIQ
ncbi:hypothetical protein [Parvicella tangerina]|uniref:2'-5' RNA ligase family protein n=1 Tax=Parvicella tangerina TaxID=2829795 RepID=A0A916JPC3_9FLAO|nr:hypothetical protein [Parvicella tangerina]CAG5085520.1 hypothetical protein CRYO30217_02783 [Parvicella tangerina]